MSTKGPDHYRYSETCDGSGVSIYCSKFVVLDETPQGYWVIGESFSADFWGETTHRKHRRWVSKTSLRRHCYPRKAEALHSFIKRKEFQLSRMYYSEIVAKQALAMAKQLDSDQAALDAATDQRGDIQCGMPEGLEGYSWD